MERLIADGIITPKMAKRLEKELSGNDQFCYLLIVLCISHFTYHLLRIYFCKKTTYPGFFGYFEIPLKSAQIRPVVADHRMNVTVAHMGWMYRWTIGQTGYYEDGMI